MLRPKAVIILSVNKVIVYEGSMYSIIGILKAL